MDGCRGRACLLAVAAALLFFSEVRGLTGVNQSCVSGNFNGLRRKFAARYAQQLQFPDRTPCNLSPAEAKAICRCPSDQTAGAGSEHLDSIRNRSGCPIWKLVTRWGDGVYRFQKRARRGFCETTGAWGSSYKDLYGGLLCMMLVLMKENIIFPGVVLLDYGSGCGHGLTFMAECRGVQGFGVDIISENVQWSQRHSLGAYCTGNGTAFLPENSFDVVFSFATLTLLMKTSNDTRACVFLRDFVRVVRPKGTVYVGWLTEPPVREASSAAA
eukprot:RCo019019